MRQAKRSRSGNISLAAIILFLSGTVNYGFLIGLAPLRSFKNPSYDRMSAALAQVYCHYTVISSSIDYGRFWRFKGLSIVIATIA